MPTSVGTQARMSAGLPGATSALRRTRLPPCIPSARGRGGARCPLRLPGSQTAATGDQDISESGINVSEFIHNYLTNAIFFSSLCTLLKRRLLGISVIKSNSN